MQPQNVFSEIERQENEMAQALMELIRTHPNIVKRLKALQELS